MRENACHLQGVPKYLAVLVVRGSCYVQNTVENERFFAVDLVSENVGFAYSPSRVCS